MGVKERERERFQIEPMRENGKKSVNEIFVEMSTLSVNLFLTGLYFGLFSSFQNVSIQIKIDKSVNGVLGIRNRAIGWKA